LHLAAQYGRLDVVKYLLDEVNADHDIIDKNGKIPLDLTTRKDIIGLFRRKRNAKECELSGADVDGNINNTNTKKKKYSN